jgi:DNA-binding NarL/FixJ family response regulator
VSTGAGAAGGQLRVFLTDDHAIVRSGIRGYLELVDDLTLVGEAASGQETLDRLAALEPAGMLPDVVLMDLVMPGVDGIEATRQIKTRWPEVEVVAVTSFADQAKVISVLEAGAAGYLLKDADADRVAAAVRAAAGGQCHLDPPVARLLADSLRGPRPTADVLTQREREVLAEITHGMTNDQIARRLGVTERTVRAHVSSILAKLGLASRTQAAVWAAQRDLAP